LSELPPREQRVSEFWSVDSQRRDAAPTAMRSDWTMSPIYQRMINRRITGSEDVHWLEWLRDTYVTGPLDRGLSLGCGTGGLERTLLAMGLCSRMVGCDIAEGSLALARAEAADMPVTYELIDLEKGRVPEGPYSCAFAIATLHHLNRLSEVAAMLQAEMEPGGLLYIFEFVGPPRFQWEPWQMELVTDIYSRFPWSHRYNYESRGTVDSPMRPPLRTMVQLDPSEAVRSSEIEEAFEPYFELVDSRAVGGTILNPLLGWVLDNFDEDNELDRSFLKTAALLEDALIESGRLRSDFKSLVYKARTEPPAPQAVDRQVARSRAVEAQEKKIEGLLARKGEERRDFDEVIAGLADAKLEADAAEARASLAARENARLKSRAVFRAARVLLRRGSSAAVPPAEPETSTPAADAPSVPARFARGDRISSALVRAAGRYVDTLGAGNASLWACWLQELSPCPPRTVLAVGPGSVADAAFRGARVEGSAAGRYDLVVAHADADVATIAGAASMVAEGGILGLVGLPSTDPQGDGRQFYQGLQECLPEGWAAWADVTARGEAPGMWAGAPSGFEVIDEARFGGLAGAAGAQVLPAYRGPDAAMAKALAELCVYAESVLATAGVVPAVVEVRAYKRGSGPGGRKRQVPMRDIVEMQEIEIARLELEDESLRAQNSAIEAAIEPERARLEKARRAEAGLLAENDILSGRGPLVYWRLMRYRRSKKS